MNTTPAALRPHIAFFGRRNVGKSSLVNQVTGQSLAVVSPRPGTTTDPVYKTMELLPAGPVVIIDTPGYDDEGALGDLRVEKTRQVLSRTDLAVLVVDASALSNDKPLPPADKPLPPADKALLDEFAARKIPYLLVYNKGDLVEGDPLATSTPRSTQTSPTGSTSSQPTMQAAAVPCSYDTLHGIFVSALTGAGVTLLKEKIAAALAAAQGSDAQRPLVADMIHPGDQIVLVIPIDESAPKGRLILPQQQVLREALEADGIVTCCRPQELARTIQTLSAPNAPTAPASACFECSGAAQAAPQSATLPLVITDSQAFRQVAEVLPQDAPLTSFSILMARYKGFLDTALRGITAIDHLQDGDRILIAEGCTHHRQCNDIGTVKIPRWLREHSQAEFTFETVSGKEYPEDLSPFRVVIHCGGCMLTEREVQARRDATIRQGIPFLNYGVLIAHMNGILARSIAPLPR